MTLPNLLIVGVSKAGTTSLFHYLGQHPEICAADVKELRYFSSLQYSESLASLETYTQHFEHCEEQRYAMEATPGYFYGGAPLAGAISELCPSARTVVILRSPEERCWSYFQFVKSKLRIPKDMTFSAYLDRCEELRLAGTDLDRDTGDFSGLVKGCYSRWLNIWTAQFGDQFRVVFFEDVVEDPKRCVKSIFEWLDIDSSVADDMQFRVDNKTAQYRLGSLQRVALALNKRAQRFSERHKTTKRILRSAYYSLNRAGGSGAMTQRERERLRAFYRPHNAELAEQLSSLGLTLPGKWSSPA